MGVHSKVGASSMYRWKACPASIRMSEGIPRTESPYAQEGTLAHEIAAQRLEEGKWPPGVLPKMREPLEIYVSTIENDKKEFNHICHSFVEVRLDLSSVYPGAFGTADHITHWPALKFLRVYDLKFGAGLAVDVEDNDQLKYYALGALLKVNQPIEDVELVIVQPRCPHPDGYVRRWKFKAFDLLEFAADVHYYAKRTEDPNAELNPGEHCRFCPASGTCPAIHKKALALAQEDFAPTLSYDPKKLAQILEWLPTLEAWTKSVREFAYAEAERGRLAPGWKLVEKRASRKWRLPEGEVSEKLKETFGVTDDDIWDLSLKSPAAFEKVIGKNKDIKEKLSSLTVTVSSGTTLAKESDPRAAVGASDFSDV